jgi:hypothetical protein
MPGNGIGDFWEPFPGIYPEYTDPDVLGQMQGVSQ